MLQSRILKTSLTLLACCILLPLAGCFGANIHTTASTVESSGETVAPSATEAPQTSAGEEDNMSTEKIIATIEVEGYGTIVLELYPDIAPQSVYNFCALARSGFYDGTIFHRVIKGFMIQGGDPTGTGTGGPGYCIKGEFAANGWNNPLKHTRGVISMARATPYDSAGCQFFICHQTAAHLDGAYAAFGTVTSGIEVVDAIANVATGAANRPLEEVVIKSVTVEGPELPEPEKLPGR